MIYLIQKGLDSEESFKIMEMVRKGKVASGKCKEWPEWKQDMIDTVYQTGIYGRVSESSTCSLRHMLQRML